jgi:hypothetical protein
MRFGRADCAVQTVRERVRVMPADNREEATAAIAERDRIRQPLGNGPTPIAESGVG